MMVLVVLAAVYAVARLFPSHRHGGRPPSDAARVAPRGGPRPGGVPARRLPRQRLRRRGRGPDRGTSRRLAPVAAAALPVRVHRLDLLGRPGLLATRPDPRPADPGRGGPAAPAQRTGGHHGSEVRT